ncbi:hypothetical protein TVAG_256880 [Trichomonas vaginalis G3]|uniref:Uncharacterized protein n=1 Tax=Trichomonas vaginalis (strain ATCC PRA-98 / G3) TaxID=412133 RepID=A2FEZ4_TRIV3|nr:armadillo (ARM) repeat-containing protein family [Trichomonas vaginalis G3]EAX96548.1 hypothetical protein TVAG_256880 [Trichomonas vaginalis G3]KAI5541084.1 armadillo (ARM) repeat-containing protein family [Trichomonas vaginalis G3]|eukprot:XP_001309478.1 hypothetical protein [Trichomonas vaginalis G3]
MEYKEDSSNEVTIDSNGIDPHKILSDQNQIEKDIEQNNKKQISFFDVTVSENNSCSDEYLKAIFKAITEIYQRSFMPIQDSEEKLYDFIFELSDSNHKNVLKELISDFDIPAYIFGKIHNDNHRNLLPKRILALTTCLELNFQLFNEDYFDFILNTLFLEQNIENTDEFTAVLAFLANFTDENNIQLFPVEFFPILSELMSLHVFNIIYRHTILLILKIIQVLSPNDEINDFISNCFVFINEFIEQAPSYANNAILQLISAISDFNTSYLNYLIPSLDHISAFGQISYQTIFSVIRSSLSFDFLTDQVFSAIFDTLTLSTIDDLLIIELYSMLNMLISKDSEKFYEIFLNDHSNVEIMMNSIQTLFSSTSFNIVAVVGRFYSVLFYYFPSLIENKKYFDIENFKRICEVQTELVIIVLNAFDSTLSFIMRTNENEAREFIEMIQNSEILDDICDYVDDLDNDEIQTECDQIINKFIPDE